MPFVFRHRRFPWTAFAAAVCLLLLPGCVKPKCPKCDQDQAAANSGGPGGGGPAGGRNGNNPGGLPDHLGPGGLGGPARPSSDGPGRPPGNPPPLFPPDAPTERPTLTFTPTITETPTITSTPTITPTATPTPTRIGAFEDCASITGAKAALEKFIADPKDLCTADNDSTLRCAIVAEDPKTTLPSGRRRPVEATIDKLMFTTDSPPKCSEAGIRCLLNRKANDRHGRTVLGYALRYGLDGLAERIIRICGAGGELSKSTPKDNALTAMLAHMGEVARDCRRSEERPSPPNAAEQAVSNRLQTLRLILVPTPPATPLPTIEAAKYYDDEVKAGDPRGKPDDFVPGKMTTEFPASGVALGTQQFASGGLIESRSRTDALGVLDQLKKLATACPAARDEVLLLWKALYDRGAGFPPLLKKDVAKPGTFENACYVMAGFRPPPPPLPDPDRPAPPP